MKRAPKLKEGEGEGKEGNACRQAPRFWKSAFTSERSAWLARLVEQYWHVRSKVCFILRGHGWYVTRIVLWLLFILVGKICPPMHKCKSIFIGLFWNVKLFLRLNKGFRPFNLFSKVPPGLVCYTAVFSVVTQRSSPLTTKIEQLLLWEE